MHYNFHTYINRFPTTAEGEISSWPICFENADGPSDTAEASADAAAPTEYHESSALVAPDRSGCFQESVSTEPDAHGDEIPQTLERREEDGHRSERDENRPSKYDNVRRQRHIVDVAFHLFYTYGAGKKVEKVNIYICIHIYTTVPKRQNETEKSEKDNGALRKTEQ